MRQLLFLFLLFSAVFCHAQEYSGKVIDESGYPIAGVSVQVKGSTSGTVSDGEGHFIIKLPKLPATLAFSAVNFKTYETTVTSKTARSFQVVLLAIKESLDEVVVTGYVSAGSMAYAASEAPAYSSHTKSGKTRSAKMKGMAVAVEGRASGMSTMRGDRKVHYTGDTTKEATDAIINAGLLTAGEINDYKKWKMWEDFNESEFRQYSTNWNISMRNRYTVQLQNKKYQALAGLSVYLIDKKKNDPVWRSVSDNTGKAELWSGINGSDDANYVIAVEGKRETVNASGFANGINNIQFNKDCGVSSKVQLSFVVDATGSMSDEIGYLKRELEDIITKVAEKNATIGLSMSSVFYRDKGDEYVTRKIDFRDDILEVVNFIKMQHAGGGGDYPEAVNDALRTAINELKWDENARARILFLVLDAPPHAEAAAEMMELMRSASAKGIRVVPIACSGTDKSTEFLMRSMALATNGSYIFLTDHSGIGGSHIAPTTDTYNVELLNDLLQRTIEQMIYMDACEVAAEKPVEPIDPRYVNTVKLKLYPNPTQGKIVIETDKDIQEMYVADFSGKLLKRITVAKAQKRFTVDLSEYPSATYFIRYLTSDGKQGAEKVILLH